VGFLQFSIDDEKKATVYMGRVTWAHAQRVLLLESESNASTELIYSP
jgi:hypothetical protein